MLSKEQLIEKIRNNTITDQEIDDYGLFCTVTQRISLIKQPYGGYLT